jgi:hypothetical protein
LSGLVHVHSLDRGREPLRAHLSLAYIGPVFFCADVDPVFVDMIAMRRVQMSIMQIVDVVTIAVCPQPGPC